MIVLIKTLQVILALSLLIFIHELGHFTFAKFFGIRVDKFFLFFDAGGFKLFSTKDTKWFARLVPKIAASDTEYGIGWLPLGGYCKICGMIDESLDLDQLKQEPKPWEFRTKKAWKRLLVMAGGVMHSRRAGSWMRWGYHIAISRRISLSSLSGTSGKPSSSSTIWTMRAMSLRLYITILTSQTSRRRCYVTIPTRYAAGWEAQAFQLTMPVLRWTGRNGYAAR